MGAVVGGEEAGVFFACYGAVGFDVWAVGVGGADVLFREEVADVDEEFECALVWGLIEMLFCLGFFNLIYVSLSDSCMECSGIVMVAF